MRGKCRVDRMRKLVLPSMRAALSHIRNVAEHSSLHYHATAVETSEYVLRLASMRVRRGFGGNGGRSRGVEPSDGIDAIVSKHCVQPCMYNTVVGACSAIFGPLYVEYICYGPHCSDVEANTEAMRLWRGVLCCADRNQRRKPKTSRRQCRHSSMFQCIGREMKSCMQLQTNTCRQSSSTSQPHGKATCPVNTPPRASHVHATCGTSPPPRPETVGPLSPRNRQTYEPARRLIGEGRNGWSRIGPCGARARIGGMYV
jgi:hypothetical protein